MRNRVIGTTDSYKFLPMERAFQGLSRAGLKGIELLAASEWEPHYDPSTATAADRKELERLLAQYGLELVSVSGHSDLCTPEGYEKFKDRIEFTASMGLKLLNTGIGSASGEEQLRILYENLRRIDESAQSRGVTVGIEPHGQWGRSGKVLADVLSEAGAHGIKINYDTANVIYYSGDRPEEDIRLVADRVSHVHMKDKVGGKGVWNFPGIGQGELDFPVIFRVLEEAGYTGPFSIEIELTPETERDGEAIDKAFADSLAYLRGLQVFDQLR